MAASWETMSNQEWVALNIIEDEDYAGYEQYLQQLEEEFEQDGELERQAYYFRHEWAADSEELEDSING